MSLPINSPSATAPRARIREVFPRIRIGRYAPGPKNSITDVAGVLVSTQSLHKPNTVEPESVPGSDPGTKTRHAVNTGVTVILPRREWFTDGCYAGIFRWNGSGEMTGSHWLEETGLLHSPVVLTNSFAVGPAYSGVYRWAVREHAEKDSGIADWFLLPVVAETFDGYLNDVATLAVTPEMIVRGIDEASDAPVAEGNTGGGTGMMCMGFKAGTGSSSRIVQGRIALPDEAERGVQYTVGVMVQANFGAQWDMHVGHVPVGQRLMSPQQRAEWEANMPKTTSNKTKDGSIIVVVATDAPLHALQLQRLAKRATTGLARTGGWGSNSSGDIFLAFSTHERIPRKTVDGRFDVAMRQRVGVTVDDSINPLFEAAADATEEAIYNALCMAGDMEGPLEHQAKAIDLNKLRSILEESHRDD